MLNGFLTISIKVPVSVFAATPLRRPTLIPRRNKLRKAI